MERIALEAGIKLLIEKNKIELDSVQKPLIEAMGEIISEDVVAIHQQPLLTGHHWMAMLSEVRTRPMLQRKYLLN